MENASSSPQSIGFANPLVLDIHPPIRIIGSTLTNTQAQTEKLSSGTLQGRPGHRLKPQLSAKLPKFPLEPPQGKSFSE